MKLATIIVLAIAFGAAYILVSGAPAQPKQTDYFQRVAGKAP